MIRLATVSLADIKSSLQPKIYAEMMTVRLAEIKPEPALSGAVENEIATLRQEVARLKQELSNVGAVPKQVAPALVDQLRAKQSIVSIAIKCNLSYKRPSKILI